MTIGQLPGSVSRLLSAVLPWIVVAVLIFNMSQRRFMHVGVLKRFATLQLAGLVAGLWVATIIVKRFGISDLFLIPVAALLLTVALVRRRSIFPHRLRCASCGIRLPLSRILYYDETRCATCAPPAHDDTEVER